MPNIPVDKVRPRQGRSIFFFGHHLGVPFDSVLVGGAWIRKLRVYGEKSVDILDLYILGGVDPKM